MLAERASENVIKLWECRGLICSSAYLNKSAGRLQFCVFLLIGILFQDFMGKCTCAGTITPCSVFKHVLLSKAFLGDIEDDRSWSKCQCQCYSGGKIIGAIARLGFSRRTLLPGLTSVRAGETLFDSSVCNLRETDAQNKSLLCFLIGAQPILFYDSPPLSTWIFIGISHEKRPFIILLLSQHYLRPVGVAY